MRLRLRLTAESTASDDVASAMQRMCMRHWQSMDFAERAARNEEVFREVNARIEQGVEMHRVPGPVPYHCECGRASCFDTISLDPPDYERVVSARYHFIVVPGHEDQAIERVVERHQTHFVVEKVGEAREQLERDHPQQRHQS
jgi:hypothetical protein